MLPVAVLLRSNFRFAITLHRCMHVKRVELYKKCYRILGIDDASDQNTVRRAYIELVKKVHPDSGQKEASADRFQEVDEAFKILQEKFAKNRRGILENEEEEVYDIRHTAPQHRQYLSYEGYGIGNPFQREKQYQQVKAMKAQERVLNHRLEKSQAGEKTLMKKGSFYKNHAIKTKYGFDRVVEDLIQEAMSKGDFNNLSGSGKPLSSMQSQNPYLDFTTHKLNKILLDNGFTPEWITLQKEIRDSVSSLKDSIRKERTYFSDYPFDEQEALKWDLIMSQYNTDIEEINKKIDKYNLIVPVIQNQLFRIRLELLTEPILNDPYLPKNQKRVKEESTKTDVQVPAGNSFLASDFLSVFSSLF